ncbi:winged helix-turn-helix domain-containing protein [Pseudokineococcus basanitobsidens]|uniref:Winged helix-turn-helix domain-containing protein n=1 Tax=Pseudokineococcus basanitobsidens TaxID=1926649 RepID=A0ABU8RM93_9ACTN
MRPGQPNRRLDDVQDLRAMAHPLRVRLYYALTTLEAATASRLAESVGESPALVSYHLRRLRDHGFVEEAPDLVNDRRERWWRPATDGFRFSLPEADDVPEARAAAVALQRTALANQLERLESWRDEQPSWGPEWSEAAVSSDVMLRLTPAELAAMNEELHAVLRAYRERARDTARAATDPATRSGPSTGADPTPGENADSADGREHIFLFLHAFPFQP